MGKTTDNLMTADDLLRLPDDGMRHELIRGELTTMAPSGFEQSETTIWMGRILANYIAVHSLGRSAGAEGGFIIQTDPDTVLAPDFSFIRKARLVGKRSPKGFYPGAPDLVVEVLSPSDRAVEVDGKTQQWLDAGCVQVWIVNLNRRTITIHQKAENPRVFRASDLVDGGELLPGFRVSVDQLLPPLEVE